MVKSFRYCDTCGREITELKKGCGYLKYTGKPDEETPNINVNLDDICPVCVGKIHNFVQTLKNK